MSNENKQSVFLSGKITNLRPLEKADSNKLATWINDPEVRFLVSNVFPRTVHFEEVWIEGLEKDEENIVFGIETKEGQFIGVMGVHRIDWVHRTCTTGAIIGEKDFWGKGFGTDAKMHLLKYIFDDLNLHKVCSTVISYNKRSLNYSLHCGYKVEGTRRKHVFKDGKYRDLIELGLFRNEWFPIWKLYQKTGKVR